MYFPTSILNVHYMSTIAQKIIPVKDDNLSDMMSGS